MISGRLKTSSWLSGATSDRSVEWGKTSCSEKSVGRSVELLIPPQRPVHRLRQPGQRTRRNHRRPNIPGQPRQSLGLQHRRRHRPDRHLHRLRQPGQRTRRNHRTNPTRNIRQPPRRHLNRLQRHLQRLRQPPRAPAEITLGPSAAWVSQSNRETASPIFEGGPGDLRAGVDIVLSIDV